MQFIGWERLGVAVAVITAVRLPITKHYKAIVCRMFHYKAIVCRMFRHCRKEKKSEGKSALFYH